ncbi:hypothetical protein [Kitasatospora sp. NPDC051914]|uniref:hypothetical protein n=1 Tax=Kitasatospora sp. NPDC051914 TaxID=3154945 RepID=UPI0034343DF1
MQMADASRERTGLNVALIDFNNLSPQANSQPTVLDTLELISILVRGHFSPGKLTRPRDAIEVECRIYDGWVDRAGGYMEKYRLANSQLGALQSLEDGVRILPRLVTSLACHPGAKLTGTYKNGGQKMVDQMLAQDAHFYSEQDEYDQILIIANDDDYVPAVLAASTRWGKPISWIRKRGSTPHDLHFNLLNVELLSSSSWA